jgi:hypothetical protein
MLLVILKTQKGIHETFREMYRHARLAYRGEMEGKMEELTKTAEQFAEYLIERWKDYDEPETKLAEYIAARDRSLVLDAEKRMREAAALLIPIATDRRQHEKYMALQAEIRAIPLSVPELSAEGGRAQCTHGEINDNGYCDGCGKDFNV